jgi:hypothetical protein
LTDGDEDLLSPYGSNNSIIASNQQDNYNEVIMPTPVQLIPSKNTGQRHTSESARSCWMMVGRAGKTALPNVSTI